MLPRLAALLALCLAVAACVVTPTSAMQLLSPFVETPTNYTLVRTSGASSLYRVELQGSSTAGEAYTTPPLVVDLHGTRHDVGYAYAEMLHAESVETLTSFLNAEFPNPKDQELLLKFVDFCWDNFLSKYTPAYFKAELQGMAAYHTEHPEAAGASNLTTDLIASRFYTMANMPADAVNIISMLENELEQGWPAWLKAVVNEIIKILEQLGHKCDAYGAWGSRTQGGLLYSSRNLDYASDTGINRNKLIIVYHIDDPSFGQPIGTYASIGFAFGLGALAGQSAAGVTTSEMNLDNSVVTFNGVPFPLRLRMVLEQATDLTSAMSVWTATNNTNSFNFLIGSAADALRLRDEGVTPGQPTSAAYALETIRGYTAQFGANSSIEAAATYDCVGDKCRGWTKQTGEVHIGRPIPEAVFRSNHGFNPRVMATQEPLFNNTVFRYDLMHDMFVQLQGEGKLIDDNTAISIVATVGTKGSNYLTCDQVLNGDNIMSIAYMPGPRGKTGASTDVGHFYVAWESGSAATWRPAACSPYMKFDLAAWM